ncbi:hypothetical protein Pmani_015054 [Petrolisthes manimaculis]|uniref:Uncharacterized protein n=1 Tax=Petrolisthes manimaculis TaxID=1843537 RepID=A0AAE1PSN7_9EUCA|nr:hypothetical protein Pmani_015054 [Petrolisthes manimaculis]
MGRKCVGGEQGAEEDTLSDCNTVQTRFKSKVALNFP